MKSKFLIFVFILVAAISVHKFSFSSQQVFSWDKAGYYLYLPATIIYHDIYDFNFYRDKGKEYNLTGGIENYGLYDLPNGNKINKYAIGVSVMQLPFFLAAHAYASGSPAYLSDGFNEPFVLAIIISTIFYAAFGLYVLRSFLLFYFNGNTVFLTLLAIAFGTNLFYYTVYDQGMSHPYSFFLFTVLLWLTHKWYSGFQSRYIVLMGAVLGLITIVRPVNILVAFVPLFWNIHNYETLQSQLKHFSKNIWQIILAMLCFGLIVLIQLGYWKMVTGSWIFYSYGDEGFDFKNPQIINGLFSYRKGWFVYTPVALLGILGFPFLWKQYRALVPAIFIFFIPMIYVVFSWHMWFYGGSFGSRPMIETLPLIAIPLASLISYIVSSKQIVFKIAGSLVFVFVLWLNIIQSYQYLKTIIHWDSMNKTYYWKIFGRTDIKREDYEKYLH